MANIMSQIKLKNKPSRNGFDLSKRNIFSAKVGELLPIYCKEVIPGDKFNINVKSFTRTMPVNTAAYTRIKEYYDWFFVPTNLLWNKFNSWVTQMSDNVQHASSINTSQSLPASHPCMLLSDVYSYIYQVMNNSYNYSKNNFGYNRGELSAKLLDYLGYGQMIGRGTTGMFAEDVALNPFPLLAYQKIYSDYYRNSQWEKLDSSIFNVDYIYDYKSPELDIQTLISNVASSDFDKSNMFDLRYANWNKDLIQGVLPNSQFGDAATVDLSHMFEQFRLQARSYDSDGGNIEYSGATGQLFNYSSDGTTKNSFYKLVPTYNPQVEQAFSILALRQAEALQKWKEITQSQQQDYKSQIEAHFGVSVSDAYSERCKYIDGFDDTIDISEVINTNLVNGDTQQIADIAGKGVGTQDGRTTFTSQVHGYLMCIYHAVPLLDYSLETRICRQNLKTLPTDYAIPELDKTGMVQVPFIELSNDVEFRGVYDFLGYAPRYYDYKTDIDEIHGSARNRNSAWVAPVSDQYLKTLLYRGDASNSPMPIDYTFFKINPAILDPIFAVQQSDGTDAYNVDSSVDSDQLLTNCYFDIKVVRNLDRDGLPY